MSEERLQVLKMLQEGKITPEEAEALLAALEESPMRSGGVEEKQPRNVAGDRRWLRVRVTDTHTGKSRVNVRLPMGIVRAGLNLGKHFAPEIEGLDLQTLLEAIDRNDLGQMVDVHDEEDGERVEVFIE